MQIHNTHRRVLLANEHSHQEHTAGAICVTMSYMKGTLTIRLDHGLELELDRLTQETGRTRSDLARDALRRQLAVLRFERLRGRVLPLAKAQGLITDDDTFSEIS